MKFQKYLFVISLLFIFTLVSSEVVKSSAAEIVILKLKCPEMSCDGCKQKITTQLKTLKGIKKIEFDLETKIITIKYDNKKTKQSKIIGAILDAGYESEVIQ